MYLYINFRHAGLTGKRPNELSAVALEEQTGSKKLGPITKVSPQAFQYEAKWMHASLER
jgi:hypothetical protein